MVRARLPNHHLVRTHPALCIPIPSLVMRRLDEPATNWLADGVAALTRWQGPPSLAHGPEIEFPSGVLVVNDSDLGFQTAVLAFGLVWFFCLWSRHPWGISLVIATGAARAGAVARALGTLLLFTRIHPTRFDSVRVSRDLVAYAVRGAIAALVYTRAKRATGSRASRQAVFGQ